jgi:DNA-binding winged helix-turn-helix (wHTH) protein
VPSEPAYTFGPYELRPAQRRLLRDGEPIALSARQADLLTALVGKAGQVVTKDDLVAAAWPDVAVTDNSVEQAISSLRRVLDREALWRYIETQPRRGYRFVAPVARVTPRETDAALEALLAPHRAWLEGRAALETLSRDGIRHAAEVFERVLAVAPDQAAARVGLANARVLQYEMTRATPGRDLAALADAAAQAREACRLEPGNAEMWATLGFVLERTGEAETARAALRRAVALEADNWRHQLRLAYGTWGEERLRAARRALVLLPGLPLAHWLAATVHVARQSLDEAERELEAGLAAQAHQDATGGRYRAVALHWLRGLLFLARGDEPAAMAAFERELAAEPAGQLYARECCGQTYYAMGVVHFRAGRRAAALAARDQALERLPGHGLARLVRCVLQPAGATGSAARAAPTARATSPTQTAGPPDAHPVDLALAAAGGAVLAGHVAEAARTLEQALGGPHPGSHGWLLPVEPLLCPLAHPQPWAGALARLRAHAA